LGYTPAENTQLIFDPLAQQTEIEESVLLVALRNRFSQQELYQLAFELGDDVEMLKGIQTIDEALSLIRAHRKDQIAAAAVSRRPSLWEAYNVGTTERLELVNRLMDRVLIDENDQDRLMPILQELELDLTEIPIPRIEVGYSRHHIIEIMQYCVRRNLFPSFKDAVDKAFPDV
jgi:hypothetical protein